MRVRFSASRKLAVMLTDAALFAVSVGFISFLRFAGWDTGIFLLPGFWAAMLLLLSSLYVFGTYDLDDEGSPFQRFLRVGLAVFVTLMGVLLFGYLAGEDRAGLFGRGVLLGSLGIFSVTATALRVLVTMRIQRHARRRKLLVLGGVSHESSIRTELQRSGWSGSVTVLSDAAGAADLQRQVTAEIQDGCDGLLLAGDPRRFQEILGNTLLEARLSGLMVLPLSRFIEMHSRRIPLEFIDASWFVLSEGFILQESLFPQRIKRLADVILAACMLAVVWPFMMLTALAVRLESAGPILYRQTRLGKDGRLFTIFKFRSMRADAEKDGARWAGTNDDRVTGVGRFIRRTRLDELPQLFNVLKGEMSFVGPRPERPEFNEDLMKAMPFYHLRHLVRPGVTGWAQVMYPYGASIEDARRKLEYDLFYIKNYGLLLDVKIVLRTIRVVLFASGR